MSQAICDRCTATFEPSQIERTLAGSYCRPCLAAETADSDRLEKQLLRSIGRRQLLVGLIMVAFGIAVLSLGLSGGSLVVIPTGMLLGGAVEIFRGVSKL